MKTHFLKFLALKGHDQPSRKKEKQHHESARLQHRRGLLRLDQGAPADRHAQSIQAPPQTDFEIFWQPILAQPISDAHGKSA